MGLKEGEGGGVERDLARRDRDRKMVGNGNV